MQRQQQQSQPGAAALHKQQQKNLARTGVGVNGSRTRGFFATGGREPEWDVLPLNPLA